MMPTTITSELAALRRLSPTQLAQRFEDLTGRAPRTSDPEALFRQLARHVQEPRGPEHDAVPTRTATPTRTSRTHAATSTVARISGPPRDPRLPRPGSTLVRTWRGTEIRVDVLDDGFAWDGATYPSLSALARAITGSRWNGRLFFGLATRKGDR